MLREVCKSGPVSAATGCRPLMPVKPVAVAACTRGYSATGAAAEPTAVELQHFAQWGPLALRPYRLASAPTC